MRVAPVLFVFPLLVGAAMAGRESDARRVTPRAPPGAASLLGGFTALAVQVLWMRADQAVLEHREDDAQLAFAAINELEPQLVSSGDYIAQAIGFNLADGHSDPAVRWSMALEGWRVLCRTVDLNPGDARAYVARGRYALLRIHRDASMRAAFRKDVDSVGALERSRIDCEEALRLRPQWREPHDYVGITSMLRGDERFESGDFDAAAKLFRRAHFAFRKIVGMLANEVDPELVANREGIAASAALATALADLCDAPPAERASRYDELARRFEGSNLPKLPAR